MRDQGRDRALEESGNPDYVEAFVNANLKLAKKENEVEDDLFGTPCNWWLITDKPPPQCSSVVCGWGTPERPGWLI